MQRENEKRYLSLMERQTTAQESMAASLAELVDIARADPLRAIDAMLRDGAPEPPVSPPAKKERDPIIPGTDLPGSEAWRLE